MRSANLNLNLITTGDAGDCSIDLLGILRMPSQAPPRLFLRICVYEIVQVSVE